LTLLLVMIGAAIGAPTRWLLDQAVSTRTGGVFPLGTWTINISGSLLLGLVLAANAFGPAPLAIVALLGTGFCGGFTTFSTFGFETIRLVESGSGLEAGINVVSSLAVGLLAAVAGWYVGQAIWA
jgi:fluoride exporter